MVRLLAYALNVPADDHNGRLVFAKGLSDAEEPDLWHRNHADEIVHWIEVGQPDERRLTKACAKAERVTILAYQASTPIWFAGLGGRLSRLRNLNIFQVPNEQSQALAALAARSLRWQITVQDALIWVSSGESTLELQLQTLHPAR